MLTTVYTSISDGNSYSIYSSISSSQVDKDRPRNVEPLCWRGWADGRRRKRSHLRDKHQRWSLSALQTRNNSRFWARQQNQRHISQKPLVLTEVCHLDIKKLTTKWNELAKSVDIDVSMNFAEQIMDLFWALYPGGYAREFHLMQNPLRFDNWKASHSIAMNLIDYSSKLKDTYSVATNLLINLTKDTLQFSFQYQSSYFVFACDIMKNWVNTWEQPKPLPTVNGFTNFRACLTGFVTLEPIALLAKITNLNRNTEMKVHWKNGRFRQYPFAQCTLNIRTSPLAK